MTEGASKIWLPIFFGIIACSWMPHWSCHYYRIETGSSFVAGGWSFSISDSLLFMVLYSIPISLNLIAISYSKVRFIAALSSGILHLTLGIFHIIRLIDPFTFKVFGFDWSINASLREILIVIPSGLACIIVALALNKKGILSQ